MLARRYVALASGVVSTSRSSGGCSARSSRASRSQRRRIECRRPVPRSGREWRARGGRDSGNAGNRAHQRRRGGRQSRELSAPEISRTVPRSPSTSRASRRATLEGDPDSHHRGNSEFARDDRRVGSAPPTSVTTAPAIVNSGIQITFEDAYQHVAWRHLLEVASSTRALPDRVARHPMPRYLRSRPPRPGANGGSGQRTSRPSCRADVRPRRWSAAPASAPPREFGLRSSSIARRLPIPQRRDDLRDSRGKMSSARSIGLHPPGGR